MKTVMTHNNGYDSILLVRNDGTVASEWQADRRIVADYLRDDAHPDLWDDQGGVEIDGRPATPDDYGVMVGENGSLAEERREFWRM